MLTGGSRTPAEDVSARPGLFLRAKFLHGVGLAPRTTRRRAGKILDKKTWPQTGRTLSGPSLAVAGRSQDD